MFKLGKINNLKVDRFRSVGAYLVDPNNKNESILLLKKETKGLNIGDMVDVFIYKDNENRLIATRKTPYLKVGDIGLLKCVQSSKLGAFLDWGLDKDLLLPIDEQIRKVRVNDLVLVRVYIDEKSDRLCASMNVKGHFSIDHGFSENEWIDGVVYALNPQIGYFILVEDKYDGLLSIDQADNAYSIGDKVHLRVSNVKKDGKLDLSERNRRVEEIEDDAKHIYDVLVKNGGYLKVNDYSSPKLIKRLFGISKSQFKRSLGRLYKLRMVEFKNNGIQIKQRGKNDR